jgi:hypothetical protein
METVYKVVRAEDDLLVSAIANPPFQNIYMKNGKARKVNNGMCFSIVEGAKEFYLDNLYRTLNPNYVHSYLQYGPRSLKHPRAVFAKYLKRAMKEGRSLVLPTKYVYRYTQEAPAHTLYCTGIRLTKKVDY